MTLETLGAISLTVLVAVTVASVLVPAYAEAMADIVIKGRARKTLTVDLVGVEYKVRVPKSAIALVLAKDMKEAGDDPEALQLAMGRWARVLFGKETGNEIMKRMTDSEDDVDIDDLGEVIKQIMETTGNPTTSPSA